MLKENGKKVKVEWYDERVYSSNDMNKRVRKCKERILESTLFYALLKFKLI